MLDLDGCFESKISLGSAGVVALSLLLFCGMFYLAGRPGLSNKKTLAGHILVTGELKDRPDLGSCEERGKEWKINVIQTKLPHWTCLTKDGIAVARPDDIGAF